MPALMLLFHMSCKMAEWEKLYLWTEKRWYDPDVILNSLHFTNSLPAHCIFVTLFFSNMCVCLLVFNLAFNNISVISLRSVLLVEKTGGPGENHRPVTSHWQTLSHNVVHLARPDRDSTHNISGDRDWLHR